MTNLTRSINRPYETQGDYLDVDNLPLAGYTNYGAGSTGFTCYKGAIIFSDVSDTAGYFSPLQSAITVASGDIFGGICTGKQIVDSNHAADGSKEVAVARNGLWAFPKGSITQADAGKNIFASDDDTVTLTSTGNLHIGTVDRVDDTYVWVDISRQTGMLSAATT